MHATDQIPGGVEPLEEGLKIGSRPDQGCRERRAQLVPQREQDVRVQVLRPRHHRGGQHEGGDFPVGRRRHRGQDRGRRSLRGRARGEQAQRPHVSRREVAPPDEGGGQGLADLARPQLQEAVPGAPGEGVGEPLRDPVVQDGSVLGRLEQNVPSWRQT